MEFDELNKTISYLEEFMKNYKFDSDIKDFFNKMKISIIYKKNK